MAHNIPPPEPPDLTEGVAKNNWKVWKKAWSNVEIATAVAKKPEPVRIATLLAVIGKEANKVYEAFSWGSLDRTEIANVLQKFDEYCEPKHNGIYDRFLFNSRSQEAGEGFGHFVTELRHLASTCEFGDKENELIRERIVLGIRDDKARAKLLREKKLTLESAQEIVLTSEVTAKYSAKAKTSAPRTTGNKDPAVECGHCGGKHGSYRKLHFSAYGKTCSRCGKQNHFAYKCKGYGQRSRPGANVREFEIGMLLVYTSSTSSEKQAVVTMMLAPNNVPFQFQIDSGAECNVLPSDIYVEVTGDPNYEHLQPTKASAIMYNGTREATVGKCKLYATRNGMKHTV